MIATSLKYGFPFALCTDLILTDDEIQHGIDCCKNYYKSNTKASLSNGFTVNGELLLEYYAHILGYTYTTSTTQPRWAKKANKNVHNTANGCINYTTKIIWIKEGLCQESLNFTCIHELFHLLHHTRFASKNFNLSKEPRTDYQASTFARWLLIPELDMRISFNHWSKEYTKIKTDMSEFHFVFSSMVRHFGVSGKTIVKRAKELKLIPAKEAEAFLNSNEYLFRLSDDLYDKWDLFWRDPKYFIKPRHQIIR